MSLLEDIQNDAVDNNTDIGTVLRKCKLLAARLGSESFENWLIWESNGYPNEADLPDYRIWPIELKGNFSGPYGTGMRNAPIYKISIPQAAQDIWKSFSCRQSISSLEQLLAVEGRAGTFKVNTGNLAVLLSTNVYSNQNCIEAWGEVSYTHVIEVVNSVRNKVLDFTLAVWKEYPEAGEIDNTSTNGISPSTVTHIFNTTVNGGSANLIAAANSSTFTFNVDSVEKGSYASLESVLKESEISEEDLQELKVAIAEEPELSEDKKFGPKVASWMGKMVAKAADGGWTVSAGAAGNILAEVLSKFYGLS